MTDLKKPYPLPLFVTHLVLVSRFRELRTLPAQAWKFMKHKERTLTTLSRSSCSKRKWDVRMNNCCLLFTTVPVYHKNDFRISLEILGSTYDIVDFLM